jgi:cell wall assembly regulator SMI1
MNEMSATVHLLSGRQPGWTFDVFSVEEWTLSNHNEKNQKTSVTTTTEETREQSEASLDALTPQEEKVVRMIHGLSEEDSRALQFALGASDDAQMKIAMIEQQLVETMAKGTVDPADDDRPSPAELLSAWIDSH